MRKPLNPTPKKSVNKSVRRATALSTLAVLALAGCQAQASTTSDSESGSETPVLDQSVLHEVDVSVDEDELTSDDWVEADVTIDGEEYADAGVRLAGGPAEAPWLISLDQFVDDQSLDGITELVVLGGDDTGEVLGEAVRLDLRAQHGPGDDVPVASSFSVNDSERELRLLVPHPDGERSDSADAEEVLDKWVALLGDQAGDLIDPETLEDDAEELREHLADGVGGQRGPGGEPGRGPGGSGRTHTGPHGPGAFGDGPREGHGDHHDDGNDDDNGDFDGEHPGGDRQPPGKPGDESDGRAPQGQGAPASLL